MKGGHFHAQGGQEDKISERRTCPPVLPVSGNPNEWILFFEMKKFNNEQRERGREGETNLIWSSKS